LFAEIAQKNLRASDLLGRLGGEEFAAVLYDVSENQAMEMAERLRVSFEQATQSVESYPVCATMSVGLVHCQTPMLDVPSLLAQADQALYFAKERGRNRVELANLKMVLGRKAGASAPAPTAQSAA
jgi:diguanylate cyclase (GGDEF)-like protein